jgi:two-component system, NtrC family, sensor histidine kinase GlrK
MLLIGFALVATVLIATVLKTTVEMRQLTRESESLVRFGVESTRHTQELLRQTTAMERTVRLYAVLGDGKLKDVYAQHRSDFERSLEALSGLVRDAETAAVISQLKADGLALGGALVAGDAKSLQRGIDDFGRSRDDVATIGSKVSAGINRKLESLQATAEEAERNLYWRLAALIPGTALIVLLLVFFIGRPIRQIDQAISELGRGTFSRAVAVQGPADLERLGRQLEWLRLRLLDLAQEKNRFLRHMSHELKTPLANIREGTELMMEGAVGPLDTAQREVVTILRENGIKLQRLIENLLSFSAWQAKSVGLELGRFGLRSLVQSVVEAQQLTLVANHIELDLKVQDAEVVADRAKLRLVLDNLLSNAVKFTPAGGVIHIHALTFRDQLTIDVADTGPGIPREERARVFEAFYTGRSPQGGHVKGTGIGLSVVMEFVQVHGGTIELVDGVHPGAHFRIRLPARSAAVNREAADAA